jgi:hypothetical protein
MAGCGRANLTYYINTSSGASSGTNNCANSTYCSRPSFGYTAPAGTCVILTTTAHGHSSLFSQNDVDSKTFSLVGAAP